MARFAQDNPLNFAFLHQVRLHIYGVQVRQLIALLSAYQALIQSLLLRGLVVAAFVVKLSLLGNNPLVSLQAMARFAQDNPLNSVFLHQVQLLICGVRAQPPIALLSAYQALIQSLLLRESVVAAFVAKLSLLGNNPLVSLQAMACFVQVNPLNFAFLHQVQLHIYGAQVRQPIALLSAYQALIQSLLLRGSAVAAFVAKL